MTDDAFIIFLVYIVAELNAIEHEWVNRCEWDQRSKLYLQAALTSPIHFNRLTSYWDPHGTHNITECVLLPTHLGIKDNLSVCNYAIPVTLYA